ncbi:MAG: MiaB/RimO family radical SAM methylthiotransferase [Patescibacteria group bacterium]
MPRKYFILTFGCQMNKSDSERISGLLLDMGLEPAKQAEAADLIILNTCSVRQTAEDRVYGLIRNINILKKKKPHLLVGITGCMAGRDKDGKIKNKFEINPPSGSPLEYKRGEGAEEAPRKEGYKKQKGISVDFFFPISDLPRLPEMIFSRWNKTIGFPTSDSNKITDYLGVKPKTAEWWRGWVVIQTGCSNYCTYCVVPYARGHEKNRSVKEILKEARSIVKSGVKEVQLLGQAVNGYVAPDPENFSKSNPFKTIGSRKSDSKDFAALLWEINQIPGVNRINFASAHPMYMNSATIKAMKLPKMANYLHLPVQSGNSEILKKMNRNYTREKYFKVIEKIKKAKPDISLASDIIVGFPGETKKQFADTISLYKKCGFDLSYNAMYSPRTGTAAYRAFADDVPREEKRLRWRALQDLMEKSALQKNKKFYGKTVEVLVDGCKNEKCWGFSREYKKVSFPGRKTLIGQVVNVKINKVKEWELEGYELI